jgi:hypothetical protein
MEVLMRYRNFLLTLRILFAASCTPAPPMTSSIPQPPDPTALVTPVLFTPQTGQPPQRTPDFTPAPTMPVSDAPFGPGRLTGGVRDESGEPVPYALLATTAGAGTLTDANGRYGWAELPGGEQRLVLYAPYHGTLFPHLTIRMAQDADFTVDLDAFENAPALLPHNILTPEGEPQAGAEVVLRRVDDLSEVWRGVLNGGGGLPDVELPAGPYLAQISAGAESYTALLPWPAPENDLVFAKAFAPLAESSGDSVMMQIDLLDPCPARGFQPADAYAVHVFDLETDEREFAGAFGRALSGAQILKWESGASGRWWMRVDAACRYGPVLADGIGIVAADEGALYTPFSLPTPTQEAG